MIEYFGSSKVFFFKETDTMLVGFLQNGLSLVKAFETSIRSA